MEFLDPKAKKRHKIQLIVGYILMGTLIGIITLILVFQAYGFDVNRQTGEVIQNGLIYVDSAPDGATVRFNGQEQKNVTNSRYSLPAGKYDLQINKNGYREWKRMFTLGGSSVERFYYPMLIPTTIETNVIETNQSTPALFTESPDRRWLIVAGPGSYTNFVEYDLGSVDNQNRTPQSRSFSIPATLLSEGDTHTYELVEWSTDNKHVLLKHVFDGKTEFIVMSRDQPETSININRALNVNPDKVVLRDKKYDQWYLYTAQGGSLSTANSQGNVQKILTNVTSFKTHDDDTVLYAQSVAGTTTQRISLSQGSNSYLIRDNVLAGPVLLDIARYDNKWYLQVGIDSEHKTYIYRDPQDTLNKKDGTKVVPFTVLKATGAMTNVNFSQNTRFLATQSGQHFEVYDAEYGEIYRYNIDQPFAPNTKVTWMDGTRFLAQTGESALIFDFDGSNRQTLTNVMPGQTVLFDRDYTVLYALNTRNELYSGDLRLPQDR
jgi:PEGA domain